MVYEFHDFEKLNGKIKQLQVVRGTGIKNREEGFIELGRKKKDNTLGEQYNEERLLSLPEQDLLKGITPCLSLNGN